jgi:TnpA family transposase
MKKILNSDDLEIISNFLNENGFSDAGLKILIQVDNKDMLRNINDDYFYRFASDGGSRANENRDADEVNVNIGGIEFSYVVRKD